MNYKKGIVVVIFIFAILALSACNQNKPISNEDVPLITVTTPRDTVQTAFDCLKEMDTEGFNRLVYYPINRKGIIVTEQMRLFGNDIDSANKDFVKSVVANLTYEIGDVQENGDDATVAAKITNYDFSDIHLLDYVDEDNPLIAAIKNADEKTITYEIVISLSKMDGTWKIIVDSALEKAIMGGLFTAPENILDDIFDHMSRIF